MQSKRLKRWILVPVAVVVGVYCAIALSPLPATIGRSNLAIASLFYPPLFNFSEKYDDGPVLEFAIGMDKQTLFRRLQTTRLPNARVLRHCRHESFGSVVAITGATDIEAAYGGERLLCMYFDPTTLVVFEFADEIVSTIEVTYVRTELP